MSVSDFIAKNIRHYARQWLETLDVRVFPRYFNLLNGLFWKYPIIVRWDEDRKKMLVNDNVTSLYFCRKSRVYRYIRGISRCLDGLARDYMLEHINFASGDWVVDCGANVGEISVWLVCNHKDVRVIAVEPEAEEADCADLNIFGGRSETVRKVLWSEETILTFYKKAETADSSVFETPGHTGTVSILATTLQKLLGERGVPSVRLLKLEAEGAEPEVLLGCGEYLEKIDFISADCGPERGMQQEATATDLINFLLPRGFDLVDMKFDRVVCLFRNRNARA